MTPRTEDENTFASKALIPLQLSGCGGAGRASLFLDRHVRPHSILAPSLDHQAVLSFFPDPISFYFEHLYLDVCTSRLA